jgi:hypothetical protein
MTSFPMRRKEKKKGEVVASNDDVQTYHHPVIEQ